MIARLIADRRRRRVVRARLAAICQACGGHGSAYDWVAPCPACRGTGFSRPVPPLPPRPHAPRRDGDNDVPF